MTSGSVARRAMVHPYFDRISGYAWLKCVVFYQETTPICLFHVDEEVGIPAPLLKKVRYQM